MTYQEILANARTCMGPYCKSCPICNGVACKNTVPGPGAKGLGTGFIRNYQKWQELCVNMDTICENVPVDTGYDFFGKRVALNMPIQGTAADIMKLAMVRVERRLAREGLAAQLIMQVHDELIVECPEEE